MPTGSVEPEDRRQPCKHQQHQDTPDTRLAEAETPRCACDTKRTGEENAQGSGQQGCSQAAEHQRTADQTAQSAGDKRDAPPTSRQASRSASLRRDGKPTSRKTTRSTSPRRNTSCGSGTGHRRDHSRSEHPRESDGRARERGRRASRSRSREQHRDMTQKRSRQYIVCTSLGRGSGLKGNELGPTFPSPPSPGLPTPSPLSHP